MQVPTPLPICCHMVLAMHLYNDCSNELLGIGWCSCQGSKATPRGQHDRREMRAWRAEKNCRASPLYPQ